MIHCVNYHPNPLSWQEIKSIYNARQDHSWPTNMPPYLYFESRYQKGDSGWICWREVMSIVEGELFGYTPSMYNQTYRIWFVKPIDEQRAAACWRTFE